MKTSEVHECPTCGESFDSEAACSNHHATVHGESLLAVELECEFCGETWEKPPGAIYSETHFCDRLCYRNHLSKQETGETLEERFGEEVAKKLVR